MSRRAALRPGVAFVLVLLACGEPVRSEPPQDDARVRALLEELGRPEAERREGAEAELALLGAKIEAPLRTLARSSDAEIALRAGRLVATIERRRARPIAWRGPVERTHQICVEGRGELFKANEVHAPIVALAGSPDATTIAFLSGINTFSLYLVSPAGADLTLVTEHPISPDHRLKWSPRGTSIAFVTEHDQGKDFGLKRVCVLDLRTKAVAEITSGPGHDIDPCWIDRGRAIVFSSNRGKDPFQFDLYRIGAAGGAAEKLTSEPGGKYEPSPSPDETRIALSWQSPDGTCIALLDLAARRMKRLTSSGLEEYGPIWSPDGSELAFVRRRKGTDDRDLVVIGPDGKNERIVEGELKELRSISWSPDGQWLAFEAKGPERSEVYKVRRTGKDRTRVSTGDAGALGPQWEPVR